MGDRQIAAGRVTVETFGLHPRCHRLLAGEAVLGEMAFGIGSSVVYTDAGGRRLRMARVSPWKAEYHLREGEQERATSCRRPLRGAIEVAFADATYFLRPADTRGSAWSLSGPIGGTLLTVQRAGLGRAEIEVYSAVEGDLLAFVYYLVVLRWSAARRSRIG